MAPLRLIPRDSKRDQLILATRGEVQHGTHAAVLGRRYRLQLYRVAGWVNESTAMRRWACTQQGSVSAVSHCIQLRRLAWQQSVSFFFNHGVTLAAQLFEPEAVDNADMPTVVLNNALPL
jgi:hypothetical protein